MSSPAVLRRVAVLSRVPELIQQLRQAAAHAEHAALGNHCVFEALPTSPDELPGTTAPTETYDAIVGDPPLLAHLQPSEWLHDHGFVLSTFAGVDALMASPAWQAAAPCTYRQQHAAFGQDMAEMAIAAVLAHTRRLYEAHAAQQARRWEGAALAQYKSLRQCTAAVLGGTGAIGSRVVATLGALGVPEVRALGSRPRESTPHSPAWLKYTDNLAQALRGADLIVNVLPSTPATRGLLDDAVFQSEPNSDAVFVNIGRGSVISEQALLQWLDTAPARAAACDVFAAEPLPERSPLWDHPRCHITPHIAAVTRATDVAATWQVVSAQRWAGQESESSLAVLDWAAGY